jgi:hypothetical protein
MQSALNEGEMEWFEQVGSLNKSGVNPQREIAHDSRQSSDFPRIFSDNGSVSTVPGH